MDSGMGLSHLEPPKRTSLVSLIFALLLLNDEIMH